MSHRRRSRLALLVVTCACASAPVRAHASRPINAWRVQSPSGATSHILGTVHVGVDLDEALGGHETLIDQARTVLLEVDFGTVSPSQRRLAMTMPEGRDLERVLGEDLFAALAAKLPHVGEAALHRMAPWVAMSMLMSLEARQAQMGQLEPEQRPGLDEQVRARANKLQIPVRGLETYADQLAMIQSIPEDSIVQSLHETLTSPDASRELSAERRDAYLRGDLDAIECGISEEIASSPGLFEFLLYARNDAWMDPLSAELERGDAFVAVGLGHLFGERGVLRQLEARGFVSERLRG